MTFDTMVRRFRQKDNDALPGKAHRFRDIMKAPTTCPAALTKGL